MRRGYIHPSATWQPDGGLVCHCGTWIDHITPGLIERFKRIPAYARSYDPGTKTWRFNVLYAGQAIAYLREAFPTVRVERLREHGGGIRPPRPLAGRSRVNDTSPRSACCRPPRPRSSTPPIAPG
ncbi:MAG: hypothetical protein M3Q65_15805 [Chloroflexota bacterium]|nr:hypothetical protein [Chloroflexota bacterium]